MIKNKKQGFTITEILLALGIVAIIATFGFKITRQGIENAYNLYYYNAYYSLDLAIKDTVANSIDDGNVFINKIARILNCDEANIDENIFSITTPNNITYTFNTIDTIDTIDDEKPLYSVTVEMPSVRRVNNNSITNRATMCLLYAPQNKFRGLIPVDSVGNTCTSSIENIQDRKDLLPFYIDDGLVGRIINGKYKGKTYYSFREAVCKVYGSEVISADYRIDCYGIDLTESGMLTIENPRKVF